MRVGIREIRHDFRSWLDRVAAGERIVVTDRGRPVADLVRHRPQRSQIQEWIDEGLAVPATGPLRAAFDPDAPITTAGSDALDAEREERLS